MPACRYTERDKPYHMKEHTESFTGRQTENQMDRDRQTYKFQETKEGARWTNRKEKEIG